MGIVIALTGFNLSVIAAEPYHGPVKRMPISNFKHDIDTT